MSDWFSQYEDHIKVLARLIPKALEKLLAEYFGVPKSAVQVISGATSRLKTVSYLWRWFLNDAAVIARKIRTAAYAARSCKPNA